MSGFYSKVTFDGGYERGRDIIDDGSYDYVLNRNAVMRQGQLKANFSAPAQGIDFYGPLASSRVTRESFIQGRGHTLSRDPDAEVTYLPMSLFNQPPLHSSCDRIDMLPQFTRVKPTCNGLRETIITPFAFSPGHFENGYLGFNNVVYSNLQSRIGPDYYPNQYRMCGQNYASYSPTRSFDKYAP